MKEKDKKTAEGILFTDEYQLTMAQLYYRRGIHEKRVHFDYFFRKYPDYGSHQAGYCVFAGLEWLIDWMQESRFRKEDIEYLRGQTGRTGSRVFQDDFLDWLLENGSFDKISMRAIPEGRVVHPNVPLVVVQGPFAMAQLLETVLLNHLNYQTLIATKASRIKEAGLDRMLIEFGLRRGQGKGANEGVRGAFIGGADFTSNVGMSHILGFPPKGTQAHSMIQAFIALGEGELGAFRAYAEIYPDDCLLLVDTINTLESGIPNAIRVFEELKKKGHEPLGIRLDSGDLAYLSIQAHKMLNRAGFHDAVIVLSNELDEIVIAQIISQIKAEAASNGIDADDLIRRLVYGVGTRLITSRGQPALDGVYKLTAVEEEGKWLPSMKISDSWAKALNPGFKLVWRLYDRREKATGDLLGLQHEDPEKVDTLLMYHPSDADVHKVLERKSLSKIEPLLQEIMREGKLTCDFPSMEEMRTLRKNDLLRLDEGVKRLINPHIYHVSLTRELWELKQKLIRLHKDSL